MSSGKRPSRSGLSSAAATTHDSQPITHHSLPAFRLSRLASIAHPVPLAIAAAAVLFVIYVATLAPGITFWDPGEFIAAVHVLGIPHPPGTPLFVLAERAWSEALSWLPLALATNLFSAACTAAAAGALALLLARATRAPVAAFGAALCAGAMSTVWLNATETEVYAASLLLASAMLLAAHRAATQDDDRWAALAAYMFGLAVPLHVSALVAAPAAVTLAAGSPTAGATTGIRFGWSRASILAGAAIVAAGVGLASWPVAASGGVVMALVLVGARGGIFGERTRGTRVVLVAAAMLLLGLTPLLFLPIRGAHHPMLNEGNPTTWHAFWDVIGRHQYERHGLWPRQAPLWAQLANLFEYADWQVALGLAPRVSPSWLRTPFTLLFACLGVVGCLAHRARDRRSWRALVVLVVCASVGLVVYLNFKAGASFGYGVLPDTLPHEARERDYFFTLAFWVWGAWAGFGAVTAVRALPRQRAQGVLTGGGVMLAALPIALNWHAVNRRRFPASAIPRLSAEALLWSAPRRGVLVTGGDNDSFPLWYVQALEQRRPDVTVVVAPLLPAKWYRAQLARRDSLLDSAAVARPVHAVSEGVVRIAAGAQRVGRPLAFSLTSGTELRAAVGGGWVLRGVVFMRGGESNAVYNAALGAAVDTSVTAAFIRRFGWAGHDTVANDLIDPAPALFARMLACPAFARLQARGALRADSLDSPCKFQ
ncbi:MAG TPA: DUF2723 domain-containing protein [Gemmatimonadaceae bacterium]|nr:DUF2723 domain-containing protein [Gemmatimonadaceae bacterium]